MTPIAQPHLESSELTPRAGLIAIALLTLLAFALRLYHIGPMEYLV